MKSLGGRNRELPAVIAMPVVASGVADLLIHGLDSGHQEAYLLG